MLTDFSMVEVTGLEPAASWSQTKHSTKLSYTSKAIKLCCKSYSFYIIAYNFLIVNTFVKNKLKQAKKIVNKDIV